MNQRHPEHEASHPDDLPSWDIGLNLTLPDPGTERPDWFDDIDAIALCLAELHAELGRDFVIGIGDNQTGITKDLFRIDSAAPDLKQLRAIIGG